MFTPPHQLARLGGGWLGWSKGKVSCIGSQSTHGIVFQGIPTAKEECSKYRSRLPPQTLLEDLVVCTVCQTFQGNHQGKGCKHGRKGGAGVALFLASMKRKAMHLVTTPMPPHTLTSTSPKRQMVLHPPPHHSTPMGCGFCAVGRGHRERPPSSPHGELAQHDKLPGGRPGCGPPR